MANQTDAISCNLECMCHPKYIKIYKGYDTYFNGIHLIHIDIEGIYTEIERTYKFLIGGISKKYENITDGFFIDLTAAETNTLSLGPINGQLIAVDADGHETPITTAIPFIVENWVQGDVDVEQVNITINVQEGDTNEYKIKLNSPYFATVLHNDLQQRDVPNCHPMSAISGLIEELETKQPVITDLDQIREGAALGATSIQNIETGGANGTISVDGTDVQVKGLKSAAFTPSTNYDAAGSAAAAETNAKNYADSLAPNYATAAQGALADSAVQTIETGSTNGTIAVDGTDVAVKGLGSAAFTASTAYATAAQGGKADTAVQTITTGTANGTINVDGTDVSVKGLGTAAYTPTSDYATASQGEKADTALQSGDIVDNTSSEATNKPLSANMGKSLQDQVNNLKNRGRFLALWNCATGLAQSNPPQTTYEYRNGDYFIVGTVASSGGTNYRPTGSSYTIGVASTVVETEQVDVNDVYYYDGTSWAVQINKQKEVSFANIAGDPYDNIELASALGAKQDELVQGTGIDIDSSTNTISNSGVRSISTGSTNGTISVDTNGTSAEVAVAGLGSAAYTASTSYATSAQGAKADSAIQSVTEGSANGTISVDGTDVEVHGLGSAAYTNSSAYDASGAASTAETNAKNYADGLASNYATAAQGLKADTAVQPADIQNMQTTTNLVTSVSSASTDTQYPSAKLLYDTIGNIESLLNDINSGS